MHLPDEDLAGRGRAEAALSGSGEVGSIPRVEQAFLFKVHLAAGDVNVNEQRIRDGDAEIRVLVAFDPTRSALLLPGGDKAGNRQRWYRQNIPIAEQLYLEYTIGQEERGRRGLLDLALTRWIEALDGD
jgi:Phage derived protein Gp49-like (DUF891)